MSSDAAKQATLKEIQGIIDFLNQCLTKEESELAKDQTYLKYHLPFANTAIQAVISREMQTRAEIAYYQSLLVQYSSQGRA